MYQTSGKGYPLKKSRKRRTDSGPDLIKSNLKQQRVDITKKIKAKKPLAKEGNPRRREAVKSRKGRGGRNSQNSDEEELEEKCAFETCLQPSGEEVVQWVQCDGGCELWFHMVCVGLTAKDINEDEDYICMACSQETVKNGLENNREQSSSLVCGINASSVTKITSLTKAS